MRLYLLCCFIFTGSLFAQNDSGQDKPTPLMVWTFDKPEPGIPKEFKIAVGPRPEVYPQFSSKNQAGVFSAKGITIPEADMPEGTLRFRQGDSITIEAWVKPDSITDGAYSYIIGKGRTATNTTNQNYALRLYGDKGKVKITFLFSTVNPKSAMNQFHRWTSSSGFVVNNSWHHIAVSYTFGDPKSILGVLDGERVDGSWDMAGATTLPPISDGDHLQIGTGNGGGSGNSYKGLIDQLAIYRANVPENVLTSSYQFVPPIPKITQEEIPSGKVRVQLCTHGLPERNTWPDREVPASEMYDEDCFGFFDVPQFYVGDGVRGERPHPYLLRATAKVQLPPGKHRILLRARGASRLIFDNQLILSTPFPPADTSGHGHVRDPESYLQLGPDFRFAPPGNRESWQFFVSKGGTHLVVLETIVGGHLGKNKRRPELGETVVAYSLEGNNHWYLLSSNERTVPYTDAGWESYHAERSSHYRSIHAKTRKQLRDQQEEYWLKRRQQAADWLQQTKDVQVPKLVDGYPAFNEIDSFNAKTLSNVQQQQKQAANTTVDYFKQVQPILEAKCYGCHVGDNAKGKLRLDLRELALRGGENDGPAITPHHIEKSSILQRIQSNDETDHMPPKGDSLSPQQIQILERWIQEGAHWPDLNPSQTTLTPVCDDYTFLRRIYLDTLGVIPTLAEIQAFEKDLDPNKRQKWIDRVLNDDRWADHWTSYWQDVLAENPNILNPTLNNSGPFRWWLYESLLDNLPIDRMVTQLLHMQGSERFGGPAGFAIASQNDSPFAAKGTIISSAFLGVEMKCARCHDAPSHRSKQQDLFQLAAMLNGKALTLPASSSVPLDKIHTGSRQPLIQVTLKPGSKIEPKWSFDNFIPSKLALQYVKDQSNPRDELAALITAPQNERFAQVLANRLWQRLMGRGIVEPVDDWEKGRPSHPELLQWLSRELVRNGYNYKSIAKLIMSCHAYQRAADTQAKETGVLFAAPVRRRLPAEAIVDSLFVGVGHPFELEEVSLDIDGIREMNQSLTLGKPTRCWMLTSTSNERDRPSLNLPKIQAVTDVLSAFGWRGARQDPTSYRELYSNMLQPAILSNGVMGLWLTRLSDEHHFTRLAIEIQSEEELVQTLFLRILSRKPTKAELKYFTTYLAPGFDTRLQTVISKPVPIRKPVPYISWSNHLDAKATSIRNQQEFELRQGPKVTDRLTSAWRQRCENVIWAIINHPECIFRP